jgi:hypothetical protein
LSEIVRKAISDSKKMKDHLVLKKGREAIYKESPEFTQVIIEIVRSAERVDSLRRRYLCIALSFIETLFDHHDQLYGSYWKGNIGITIKSLSNIIGGNLVADSNRRKSHVKCLCEQVEESCGVPKDVATLISSYDIFPTYKEYRLAMCVLEGLFDSCGMYYDTSVHNNPSTWINAVTENLFTLGNHKTLRVVINRYSKTVFDKCDNDVFVRFMTKILEDCEEFDNSPVITFLNELILDHSIKCEGFYMKWIEILTKRGMFNQEEGKCGFEKSLYRLALSLICGIAFTPGTNINSRFFKKNEDFLIDEKNGAAFMYALSHKDSSASKMRDSLLRIVREQRIGDEYFIKWKQQNIKNNIKLMIQTSQFTTSINTDNKK